MNCKNLHLILAFLAYASMVSSNPIKRKEIEITESEISEKEDLGIINNNGKAVKGIDNAIEGKSVDIKDVCNTPECQTIAEGILSKINEEIDPCNDFYEFVCGNWMKNNEIPVDKPYINIQENITTNNIDILTEVINSEYKPNNNLTEEQKEVDKHIFTQIQNAFKTCMDTDTINSKGKEPLIKLLSELNIHDKKADYSKIGDLTDLLVKIHSYDAGALFSYTISSDKNNPKINDIYIYQGNLGLPSKEYYNSEKMVSVYKQTIHDMFTNIFNERSKEEIEKLTTSVYDLEVKIANISLPIQDVTTSFHNPNSHKRFNVDNIGEAYPYIDWKSFFTNLFEKLNIDKKFTKDISIVDINGTYFENLGNILKSTDNETLTAYIEWTVIRKYGEFIDNKDKTPLKVLNKNLTGAEENNKRNEYCIENLINPMMGRAVGKLFIDKAFNGNSKEMAENIIDNIKEAMVKRIPNISWLDKETADYAIKKTQAIYKMIGYPDYINDPIELAKDYEELEIDDKDFFTNIINSKVFNIGKKFKLLFEPVKIDEWEMYPHTTDAYYHPLKNQIVFPAGILQIPFFNSNNPYYLNYGGFGSVAGHELTHAFDNSGKLYDSEGRFKNWWTNSTDIKFEELSQCFIDEYSSFSIEVDGEKYYENGLNTLGENLADNGGLDRAYEAWKLSNEKDVNANENNKLLPGLTKYNQDQLFYIAFGHTYCANLRPELALNRIRTDVHSLPQYRVNGVIYNSNRFAKIFNCPTNSPMNPEKKCVIW